MFIKLKSPADERIDFMFNGDPLLFTSAASYACKIEGLEKDPRLLRKSLRDTRVNLAYRKDLPPELLTLLLKDGSYAVRKAAFENHWAALSEKEALSFIERHPNFLEEFEICEDKDAEKALSEQARAFWKEYREKQKALNKEKEEAEFTFLYQNSSITIKGVERFLDFLEAQENPEFFSSLDLSQDSFDGKDKRILAKLMARSPFAEIRAWAARNCDIEEAQKLLSDRNFAVRLGLSHNQRLILSLPPQEWLALAGGDLEIIDAILSLCAEYREELSDIPPSFFKLLFRTGDWETEGKLRDLRWKFFSPEEYFDMPEHWAVFK